MSAIISIIPEDSLVHENVSIVVSGLQYCKIYKLELRLVHKVGVYRSFGVYKSSVTGTIDLTKAAPLRGTYSGLNERGLFESVEPSESVRYGAYCNCTPPVDFQYHFIVTDSRGRKVGEKIFKKRLIHPLVERIEVEESFPKNDTSGKPKVTGTIFKPPGDGPFPSVIDISGTGGGLNEQKGAALASRGFVVLSLAFFKYKRLPKDLQAVELQYFEDATNYITSLTYTSDRIGFQGVSFGGTLVMLLSTKLSKIKAVCSINGSFALDQFAYILINGKQPPIGRFVDTEIHMRYVNELMVYTDMVKNVKMDEGAAFRLEDSQPDTAYRFTSAVDDLSTPTVFATNLLSNRLRQLNRKVDVDFVPGGHLLDPPCFPQHAIVFSSIAGLLQAYGGETSLHGKSQFEVWERTVQFFSEHLGAPTPLPDYLRPLGKL